MHIIESNVYTKMSVGYYGFAGVSGGIGMPIVIAAVLIIVGGVIIKRRRASKRSGERME